MFPKTVSLFSFLALTNLLQAGPINYAEISSEISEYSHLDFEGIKQSKLNSILGWNIQIGDELGILNLDLVKSVTRYELNKGAVDEEVVLIRLPNTQAKILEIIKQKPSYAAVDYQKHSIHHFLIEKQENSNEDQQTPPIKTEQTTPVYLCFLDTELLIVSKKLSCLLHGVDVLDGRRTNFIQQKRNFPVAPQSAMLIHVSNPQDPKPFNLFVGSKQDQYYAKLTYTAETVKAAKEYENMLELWEVVFKGFLKAKMSKPDQAQKNKDPLKVKSTTNANNYHFALHVNFKNVNNLLNRLDNNDLQVKYTRKGKQLVVKVFLKMK